MKNAIKCLIGLLILAMAWVLVIEVAYGVPNPSTKRIFVGMLIFFGMMFAAIYIIEPSIINKRIYGIAVCMSAHRRVKKAEKASRNDYYLNLTKFQKSYVLYETTGCHGYYELYRYASQKVYFKR